jgi:TPR repeat protein
VAFRLPKIRMPNLRLPRRAARFRPALPASPVIRPPTLRRSGGVIVRVIRSFVKFGFALGGTSAVIAGAWFAQQYGYRNIAGLALYAAGRHDQAAEMLKLSAARGEPYGQNNLGVLYDRGIGVRQDRTAALKLYKQAAAQGVVAANYNMARLLDRGLPPDQRDKAKALTEYERAARNGDTYARAAMANLVHGGDLASGARAAREWMKSAAAQGVSDAQLALARSLRSATTAQERAEAREWLKRAAEGGNATAAYTLALSALSDNSLGPAVANHWLTVAAEDGFATAAYHLARNYTPAAGLPTDVSQAIHWYTLAANAAPRSAGPQRLPPVDGPALHAYRYPSKRPVDFNAAALASLTVAHIYADGMGVPQDFAKAAEFYRRAAELGVGQAAYYLGNLYRDGRGVPRDREAAYQWYRKAAEQGDSVAELLAHDMSPLDKPTERLERVKYRARPVGSGPAGERYEAAGLDLIITEADGGRTRIANWVNGDGGIVIEDVVDDSDESRAVAGRAAPLKQSARQ